jgi:hypothetical protein
VAFHTGAILVKYGTILPATVALERSALALSWRCVSSLDRVGYMAGTIDKLAFGLDEEKRGQAAWRLLTWRPKPSWAYLT